MLIDTDIEINGVVTKEKPFIIHNIVYFLQGGFSINSVTTPTRIFTAETGSDFWSSSPHSHQGYIHLQVTFQVAMSLNKKM